MKASTRLNIALIVFVIALGTFIACDTRAARIDDPNMTPEQASQYILEGAYIVQMGIVSYLENPSPIHKDILKNMADEYTIILTYLCNIPGTAEACHEGDRVAELAYAIVEAKIREGA